MQGCIFSSLLALTLACLAASSAAQGPAPTNAQDSALGRQVKELLQNPSVSRAHWGIAVTTLSGTQVLGIDEGKLFRPASTAKLFTMAAALTLLGPDFRFATRAYGDLDTATGTVRGDLTLVGGGDPSFGTEDLPYQREKPLQQSVDHKPGSDSLASFVDGIVGAGVKQITGNLIGDDTLFEAAAVPEGWAQEDLLWGYGALPNALALQDNQLRITVQPPTSSNVGVPPTISIDQLYPYLNLQNDIQTSPARDGHKHGIDVEEIAESPQTDRLFGSMAAGASQVHETVALHDPSTYAAGALRALLKERSVDPGGQAETRHQPHTNKPTSFLAELHAPGCENHLWGEGPACVPPCADTPLPTHLIAEHLSRPLIEDVAFTLKTSANLHAEMILHHLGLPVSCKGVTTLGGARMLHAWLLHVGLQDGDFVLYDGSGLSTKDLITPRSETQLLAYAATQPWFPQWMAALPVGGVDGTLGSRFTEAPLKGQVFAKTGTLGETRALAGYVRCASGKQMIFSILVDNHEPGSAADREVMDKIVGAIAQND